MRLHYTRNSNEGVIYLELETSRGGFVYLTLYHACIIAYALGTTKLFCDLPVSGVYRRNIHIRVLMDALKLISPSMYLTHGFSLVSRLCTELMR